MAFLSVSAVALLALSTVSATVSLEEAKRYFANLTPYSKHKPDFFGVKNVGMPEGCQVEQVHLYQRHAERFYQGVSNSPLKFAPAAKSFLAANPAAAFKGPLAFLNHYSDPQSYTTGYQTGRGAASEFQSGVDFWNEYGRIVYNASAALLQLAFEPAAPFPKPLLRTTEQQRMWSSQINFALGFFGSSNKAEPDPSFADVQSPFNVVKIPELSPNNTLSPIVGCRNSFRNPSVAGRWAPAYQAFVAKFTATAVERLQAFAPEGFNMTSSHVYDMMQLCAYDVAYLGTSSYCTLFTKAEWAGFARSWDIIFYYYFSFGSPVGRALGVGYTTELLARLQNQYINVSQSSVNSTLDSNPETFPLGQPMYVDIAHDAFILATLTAMGLDYFKSPPDFEDLKKKTTMTLPETVPFNSRLVTEVIGCAVPNPKENRKETTFYTPTQYGYNPANATHKFVRMRLNNGILPLRTLRNIAPSCQRSDGLCDLPAFIANQQAAIETANYAYACYGAYTASQPPPHDYDGTIFAPTS